MAKTKRTSSKRRADVVAKAARKVARLEARLEKLRGIEQKRARQLNEAVERRADAEASLARLLRPAEATSGEAASSEESTQATPADGATEPPEAAPAAEDADARGRDGTWSQGEETSPAGEDAATAS